MWSRKKEKTTDKKVSETTTVEETTTESASEVGDGYKINQVGTIKDTDHKLQISHALVSYEGSFEEMYDHLGKSTGKKYLDISELQDDESNTIEDYKVVSIKGKYPNITGIVDLDGNEIIPCNAAVIKGLSDRYIEVIVGTKETKKKSNALFYASKSDFISVSGPKDEDVLYEGYGQVYDLQQKAYVPGVKITSAAEELKACGNSIYWKKSDGSSSIVDSTGKEIINDKDKGTEIEVENGLYKFDKKIYDDTGKEIAAPKDNAEPYVLNSNGQYVYYSTYENEKYYTTVLDKNGNTVFDNIDKDIKSIYDDVAEFQYSVEKSSQSKVGLMTLDGKVIVEKVEGSYFRYEGNGYWEESANGLYSIINKTGEVISNLKDTTNLICAKDGTDECVAILDTSKTFKKDNMSSLTTALAKYSENSKYGLVDMYTGEKLLPCEYEEISYASGYVYAYKLGQWEVYELSGGGIDADADSNM